MPDASAQAGAAPQFKHSREISVSAFRQILWLPLRTRPGTSASSASSAIFERHWELLQGDMLSAADSSGASGSEASDYAAYLYFHPYIRRFLFDCPPPATHSSAPALAIWRLREPQKHRFVDALMPAGQWGAADATYTMRFGIERCLLYQFSVGVVMLEVELVWKASLHSSSRDVGLPDLSLAEVLDALDFLRRTHPGYFPLNDPGNALASALHLAGGRYPLAATVQAGGHVLEALQVDFDALATRKQAFLKTVKQRQPDGYAMPLGEPWRRLLGPVADWTVQLEDERMPYMAYVAVSSPHRISKGDWVRLAGADHRGDSATAPYGQNFLCDFERDHFYDRYFCSQQTWTSTRFLNTGYAFTMVGASGSDTDFFTSDGLLHFRRMYACIGLLAQFNKAALLLFSNRLSEAIDQRNQDDGSAYRASVRKIQGDLLEFTHRYWFDGVSNQLQAGELQAQWFKHLRLQALYDAVMAESRAAHDYVIAEEERLQTEEQQIQTKKINDLTQGALVVAVLGLLLAAMGGGFPFDKALAIYNDKYEATACWLWQPDCTFNPPRSFVLSLSLLAAVALVAAVGHLFLRALRRKVRSKDNV